jgi:hypothetical protein
MYILDLVNYTQLRFENVVLWNKMKNKQTIPHSSKNKQYHSSKNKQYHSSKNKQYNTVLK